MTEIRYPTEKWLTAYCATNACDRETAETAWWDNEIDHDRPTPFDLTEEQAKVAKTMTKGAKAVDAYGKATKRERKPDEEKRELIRRLAEALADLSPEVVNPEREIRFGSYSVTLTRHRPPKG